MLTNQEIIDKFENIVVQIQTHIATGSGFYLRDYDVIITNYHVINGSNDIVIKRHNEDRFKAEILYLDPSMDVAFLRLESPLEDAEPVTLKSPNRLESGATVIAIGHPHGLKFTTTQGIISKVDRLFSGLHYVQTDAAINPGNSGGPLIDTDGNIIGINTFIISQSNNLGFALHIDQIFDHLEMILHVNESIFLCPACSNELKIAGKFCPFCGEKLPDNLPVSIEGIDHQPPETIIERVLVEVGINPLVARSAMNFWQFEFGSAIFTMIIQDDGTIFGIAYLAKLPKDRIVDLYEYLLRENPKLGTILRFGAHEKHITLSFAMNAVSLNDTHFAETVRSLLLFADKYDDVLRREYNCEEPDRDLIEN